jgi:hypothetical protein
MANLSYKSPSLAGVDPAFTAAGASGDVVPTHPNGYLAVKNGDATSTNVTIATPGKSRFGIQDEPDLVIAVPAGATRMIGPMRSDLVDPDLGGVAVSYSKTTSLTVAAIRC